MKFAETLSTLIKEKQIKLGDVSAAVGVTNQSISAYCLGNITPKYSVLLKIADYFGVTPTYLLTGLDASNEIEHKDLGLSGTAIRQLKKCQDERVFNFIDELLSDPEFYRRVLICFNKAGVLNVDIGDAEHSQYIIERFIEKNNGDRNKAADDFLDFMGYKDGAISILTSYIGEMMLEKSGVNEVIDALTEVTE
ncbi:MAG: helix-turn-helix transcriptional regulator [Synergistaceae bacterium]|nr:helix-turn-helix transcriptional regulator [Synergistaceae bacterium]MBQ8693429.1 helix-turn-helix transcriptional regulator [Synergistaceae bacterium]